MNKPISGHISKAIEEFCGYLPAEKKLLLLEKMMKHLAVEFSYITIEMEIQEMEQQEMEQ